MSSIIDSLTKLAEKFSGKYPGEASGVATLDGSSKVVEDPGSAAYTKDAANGILGLDANARVASDQAFSTGGSDTHKAMGAIHVDTSEVSRTTTGVLMSYTLPANTLNANNKLIRFTAWGESTGSNAQKTVGVRTGTTPTSRRANVLIAGTLRWSIIGMIVRTGTGATLDQYVFAFSGSAIAHSEVFSTDLDLTTDQTIDFFLSSINASDNIKQMGLVIELLN